MDPLLQHIHPLDALEAEQELDLVDGRVGGHRRQDRPTFWLNETSWMRGQTGLPSSAVRLKHEPSPIRSRSIASPTIYPASSTARSRATEGTDCAGPDPAPCLVRRIAVR